MMKGNPFKVQNQMQRMMDLAKQAKALSQNPSGICEMLLNNGRINQDQYNAIKDMKSPSEIGNYLMNNGVLNQQQVNQMYQYVPQVQQAMNQ